MSDETPRISITDASSLRLELARLGYTPLPLHGKVPPPRQWTQIRNVTPEMVRMWGITWPDATNTGCLTRDTPAFDADIIDEAAAIAVEDLVRERFEERSWFLVRIGQAPKRAFLFRCDQPFKKITVNLAHAGHPDAAEKLELLADGQQLAVHGIHPDTGRPYRWFGGVPWQTRRGELPYLHPHEAQQLVTDAVALLTTTFGYSAAAPQSNGGKPGVEKPTGEDRWRKLIDNIHHGRALHDSIRDLAAMLMASGMRSGAAAHLVGALLELAEIPHDERWEARCRGVPRAIDSARQKYSQQR